MAQTRLLSCLEADWQRIREVAPGRLDERVPTCPDWTVADLVRHVAQVYGPEQTMRFWIRRTAQETAVHRIDAELGAGAVVAPVSGDLAVDGVDELLQIFMGWGFTEWPEDFADALQSSPGHGFLIRADAAADSEAAVNGDSDAVTELRACLFEAAQWPHGAASPARCIVVP